MDKIAAIMSSSGISLSYGRLDACSRKLANRLDRAGLQKGDRVAIVLENNLEWFVAQWGVRRAEMFFVPVNWHLAPVEIRHVIANSESRAIIASAMTKALVAEAITGLDNVILKLSVGGTGDGFTDFENEIEGENQDRPPVEFDGNSMPYSSGTTGFPKGIMRTLTGDEFGTPNSLECLLADLYQIGSGCVYLSPAPAYHSSPVGFIGTVLNQGGTIVHMPRFDAEEALRAIAKYKVTHAQFVPTHFVRMLRLAPEIRARYDLSSLTHVIHAAAPCAPDVKQAMVEWLGPIVYEYYSGSERCGLTAIDSEEWSRHQGSVGRSRGGTIHIVNPQTGAELSIGQVGLVYFENPVLFSYYGDPEKTAATFSPEGWGTHGDLGYIDDEGYLYLCDRRTDLILSGGVNIYPQEIENVLNQHPAVADCAVVGLADAEFGQIVVAMVQPETPHDIVPADVLAQHCRKDLAGFKVPRVFHFCAQLPRLPNGKLLRRNVVAQLENSRRDR